MPTRAERRVGVALVAVSAISFAVMAIFARAAYDAGADVTAVLLCRFVIAAACLGAVVALRRMPLPRGRTLAGLVAMGALGYTGQSLAFFTALTRASAGLVALLLYLYPAIVTVLTVVLFRERLTRPKGIALGLALVGTALTVGRVGSGSLTGVALGVAAACIYSCFIVAGSRITRGVGATVSTAVITASCAVMYVVIAAVQRPAFPETGVGWAAVVAIGVVCTVVAIGTFLAGIARLGPADASSLSTLEPVVTVVLAAVILGEALGPVQALGGALILAAVLVLSRTEAEPGGPPPTRTEAHGAAATEV